jgi:hypothetical protein
MQTNNTLGYVVWGVKNGFQNNMFSHNLTDTIKNSLIDIQELCMPQYSDFYSISKVGGHTLVSLYDPTTMDYSGSRKAYIVFSIIFPQGTAPSDDVLELLGRFKNYYKVESNGLPSQEIFYRKLAEYNVKISTGSNSSLGTQVGYINYASLNEIKNVFADLDILDYHKVYFFDRPNSYVLSNPNFVAVASLERKYTVQILNYNGQDYQIFINGINVNLTRITPVAPGKIEITDLNKTDKIEIKRGGVQLIESFFVRDKQTLQLPAPKIEHQGYFTIRGLDPSRYRVKVNGQEQPTSHMSGRELKIAISTEHVVVEIVDKITNAIVQTHDTRINKTYVMLLQGGNGTYPPPGGGTGGNGGSGGGGEEPKKKKTGLILTLCSVVLLAGLGITGWQLGWFKWGEEQVVGGTTTTNAEPTKGTGNVTVNPQPVENSPLNPEGYIVKSDKEDILTEKGLLHSNNRYYRYLNGKWEYSEKSNKNNWNTATNKDIEVIQDKYFDKNTTPTPSPQPKGPQPPGPQPPGHQPPGPYPPKPPTPDANECMVQQIKLDQIASEAKAAQGFDPAKKATTKTSLKARYDDIFKSGTSCELNFLKAKTAINNL